MSIKKDIQSLISVIFVYNVAKILHDHLDNDQHSKQQAEDEKKAAEKLIAYAKKINDANRLINDESNRLITWCLSIIGGSILAMVSTSYIRPAGIYLYAYLLFPIGWVLLGISLYYGELTTRIYIAGATVSDENVEDIEKVGLEADKKFANQLTFFRIGIITFFLWLVSYLIWVVFIKS
jgi:hypothetical protein